MSSSIQARTADVIVVGGGLGGVAAALRICAHQKSVIVVEPTAWLGGQATSQGVSALDEHRYIEQFGATPQYAYWRTMIRRQMASLYDIVPQDINKFNPGNGWVSNLCFFPEVAKTVIDAMLQPYVDNGQCTILHNTTLHAVERHANRIVSVLVRQHQHVDYQLHAPYIIDATELGDVLAYAGLEYVTGVESHADTGEHLAPQMAKPHEIQGFTYGFAVTFRPNESHIIAKPEGYEQLRDRQPFTLTLTSDAGEPRPFAVFQNGPTGLPPFWTYRRLWDGGHTTPTGQDIALINWNSNDYHHGSIIDESADVIAMRLDEAKRLSLAFLYWMQTEMPRDDGGMGYPELQLVPGIMGTADGLSMAPYIRESRRTRGLTRIVAEDLLVSAQPAARAKSYDDAVGVGWYFMDLHPAPGNPKSMFAPTRPFQIPLGALIPPDCTNLIMGNKNIATTHLSNGSYRLHPVEWNIGAVAGECCVYALETGHTTHEIWHQKANLSAFQRLLITQHFPLAWTIDIPSDHACYCGTQWMVLNGVIHTTEWRGQQLEIACHNVLTSEEWERLRTVCHTHALNLPESLRTHSWHDVSMFIAQQL